MNQSFMKAKMMMTKKKKKRVVQMMMNGDQSQKASDLSVNQNDLVKETRILVIIIDLY
jgi:hypothetical protein